MVIALFCIATLVFIAITEIANYQLLEIVNKNERINSEASTRLAFRLIIPTFLCTLNFLLLFFIIRFYKKNNKLFLALFCLWLSFVSILAWRIKSLVHNGVNLPIVDQWPLATGFILASSLIAIVISISIKKIENKRELIKSLYEDKAKYASQLSEQLEENRNNTELLKEQSERLKVLDSAKSRFFAGISHEFRTPLTLIQGPLTDVLTANKGELSTRSCKNIDLALTQTTHLLDLVEELLDFSRLEAGTFQIHNEEIDFSALLGIIIDQLDSMAQAKGVHLRRRFCSESICLRVDPKQIRKVLINLLINAIKFSPEHGYVLIELEKQSNTCLLHVKDNGPGISEPNIDLVFQPFQQVENYAITNEGVGLGLPLAREIAQLHDGSLNVSSTLGRGSCFTLVLPLHAATLSSGAIPTPVNKTSICYTDIAGKIAVEGGALDDNTKEEISPNTTILVVEDNIELRRYIINHLKQDYCILESKNGETGYTAACLHMPDLIISDIMMPVMDGLELCQKIKSNIETDFIPIIMLTALAEDNHRIDGFDAKADDYLGKPFNPEVLKARVKNILQSRQSLLKRKLDVEVLFPLVAGLVNKDKNFSTRIQKEIKAGLSDKDFSVEKLASAMFMDRSTLARKSQKIFDVPAGELITKARLEWARELLKADEGSISEIAFTIGFSTTAHFSHSFKKAYGASPSSYRKSSSANKMA